MLSAFLRHKLAAPFWTAQLLTIASFAIRGCRNLVPKEIDRRE